MEKGCGLYQCFTSTFEIIAQFPQQKFGSILPYFRGRNMAAFRGRHVIADKTLFSPSFLYENTAKRMPHFYGENPAKFRVWCAMAHR